MTRTDQAACGIDTPYTPSRPALLFGSDVDAMRRTGDLFSAAGVRLAGQGDLAAAVDRLDDQVAVGLVWIECDEAAGIPSDALLDRLARIAESGEASVVASAPTSMIDLLFARLDQSPAQILIDADDIQRAAALSVALSNVARPARVSDVGRDNAVRLRQLSDEMGRIAETLARLSATPDEGGPSALRLIEPTREVPPLSVDIVRSVIRARRLRSRFFAEELFADPAWDMRSNRSEILIRSKGIRCIPGSALVITHRDPNPSGVNGDPRSTGRAIPKQQSKAAPMAGPPLARVRSPPRSPLRSDRGVSEGRALTGCRAPAALRNGALNRRLLVEHQPVLKGTP